MPGCDSAAQGYRRTLWWENQTAERAAFAIPAQGKSSLKVQPAGSAPSLCMTPSALTCTLIFKCMCQ